MSNIDNKVPKRLNNVLMTFLQALSEPLLAEEIISHLRMRSDATINYSVQLLGAGKRPHHGDIERIKELNNGSQEHIYLELNRNGIADALPEGIVYAPAENKDKDATTVYKPNSALQDARHFFSPFENELFRSKTDIHLCEHHWIGNINEITSQFLIDFWDLDKEMPLQYLYKLALVLPHTERIKGNYDRIVQCLSEIIGQKVAWQIEYKDLPVPESAKKSLSDLSLGGNAVCGQVIIADTTLELTIMLPKLSMVADYLEGSENYKFIQYFIQFFVSFDVNTNVHVEVEPEQNLHIEDSYGILGFSTI